MGEFDTFETDFIIFILEVDDESWILLADEDSVWCILAGLNSDTWRYFYILVVKSCV